MARCECATIRHREAKLGQVFCSAKKKSQVFLGEKQLWLLWVISRHFDLRDGCPLYPQ